MRPTPKLLNPASLQKNKRTTPPPPTASINNIIMTKEVGMLDVGTHCALCREIDFLPFHCSACNSDFCAKHRLKEDHYCESLRTNQKVPVTPQKESSRSNSPPGAFFQSLLPAKAHDRVQTLLQDDKKLQQQPNNMKSALLASNTSQSRRAIDKLKRFFAKNGKTFENKKSTTKLSSANKLIQVTKMKRTAIGDNSIPLANRIYVWCYVVADSPQDQKKPSPNEVFISKTWPIGRALDSLASILNVKNSNIDHAVSDNEKLFLYRGDPASQHLLPASGRVASLVKEGDTLYLVRGLDVDASANE